MPSPAAMTPVTARRTPTPVAASTGTRQSAPASPASRNATFDQMLKARAERWQQTQLSKQSAANTRPTMQPARALTGAQPQRSATPATATASAAPRTSTVTAAGSTAPAAAAGPVAAASRAAPTPPTGAAAGTTATQTTHPVSASSTALQLSAFPRPRADNGRGIHWVPTVSSTNDVVDRFVKEAADMKMKWVVLLNDGTKTGDNDYLVRKLVENGIEPVMRVYTPPGKTIDGDLQGMVRHYKALGVNYYQLYNEPNLRAENAGAEPDVNRYLDQWLPAAKAVVAAGGYPGFGSLAPGGDADDIAFFKGALDGIKARGEVKTLDRAWISMHNYTFNHPIDYAKDSNGFLKFRWYDQIVREKLGRSMPIIGTEGGTFVGASEDRTLPPVDESKQVQMVVDAYKYMRDRREPYCFAYSYWVIANEEGGGHDAGFSNHALFKPGRTSPVVQAVKQLA